MSRPTRDQVLRTLQTELAEAQNAGKDHEIKDIETMIRHYTQRPLKETDAYIRDVRLANGRLRQRRWRTKQPGAIYPGDWVRVPNGDIKHVERVEGKILYFPGPGTNTCPVKYATRADIRETVSPFGIDGKQEAYGYEAVSTPCPTCRELVTVADAFYHTVADVLEAGLTPASATDLQGALDAYEAALTALGQ